ncbi:MAG: FAD-dependent thymidylate synthase [Candidatus Methanomethylophilaceae archaeon]|nr:FAD-dependent thymidylate synthase [Candidatus Methanomethylophilaceae archaeon]
MKVDLIAYTQNADALCAAAGKSCYSSRSSFELMESISPGETLGKIVGMGHHSVIEHAVFTFSVSGVSRALTHQLVRHRVASFSQQSQRYVSISEPSYVVPHSVENNPEAAKKFREVMDVIWEAYGELEKAGIPPEDARYLLPNGCTTNITITMNARELLHFFSLRCCSRAQWEIREMADKMLELCIGVSPIIFGNAGPPCVRGPCPEGKLSCGKPRRGSSRQVPNH